MQTEFSIEQAEDVARRIGVDLRAEGIEIDQFRRGMIVELEHGARDPQTDVTHDDPVVTGKIALAHLREIRDYYTRLEAMEAAAESGR